MLKRFHYAVACGLLVLPVAWISMAAAPAPANPTLIGIVPPGAILPFAGTTPPAGYLLCDGAEVLETDYPRLFNAIGTAWGTSSSFTFRVPDLRGRFPRGVDGQAGNDPNSSARIAIYPGGSVGNNVGSLQGDGRRGFSGSFSGTTSSAGSHRHDILTRQDDWDEDDGVDANAPGWADDARSTLPAQNLKETESDGAHVHSFSVNVTIPGEAESRPTNVYVQYIIKF